MKTLSIKQYKRFSIFIIVSGLGALWLTFWWYMINLNDNSIGGSGSFSSFKIFFYYIFNSVLLIFLGIILYARRFKLFSVLAVVLGISVTSSFFIFGHNNANTNILLDNLFVYTTYLGMTVGTIYGGVILVPMFIVSVYISFVRGIQHVRGKLDYNTSIQNTDIKIIS